MAAVFVDSVDGANIGMMARETSGTLRAIRGVLGEALPLAFLPMGLPGSSVAGKMMRSKAGLGRISGRAVGAMVEAAGLTAMSEVDARPAGGYGKFRMESQGKTTGWLTGNTPANEDLEICDSAGRPVGQIALTRATKSLLKRQDASCDITLHTPIDPAVHALASAVAIALLVDAEAAV